jgi:hypothetical protein
VPLRRVGYNTTIMTGQMVPNPLAQRVVVGDGHHASLCRRPKSNALAGLLIN